MRALVLGNDSDHDPALIGARAEFHGYQLEIGVREDHGSWPTLDGVGLVISLGSEWSVYWDHVQRHVEPEIALLQEAQRRDIPVFGICFGSQLLAAAHGGSVARSPLPEIGWFEVRPTEAGRDLIEPGPWFQWHDDRWRMPSQATLLAENDAGNQAFSIGRTLATQFHPELTERVLHGWLDQFGGRSVMASRGIDVDQVLAQTAGSTSAAQDRASALFDGFVKGFVR